MKIIQKFQALKPALLRLRHEMAKTKGKLHIVFDIDDTIIFDNARSTPNLQVVEFLKEFKKGGHSIHLVTARSTEARQDTLLELNRVGMPFDTLDLCPEKMREDLAKVSKFKFQMRKK
jgi:predicted HAD superfamily phosphohydrolase YqeG